MDTQVAFAAAPGGLTLPLPHPPPTAAETGRLCSAVTVGAAGRQMHKTL